MLDRILASANPDGLLFDEIGASDLAPLSQQLSDNWGYVYGAVYTHYMVTGDERYREAVRRVLRALPRYRGHDWERGSHDGYADAIESAIYLVAREPVPEALDWIESETKRLVAFQQEDGTIERWYGDGNWSRTLLLYAMMKTQGAFLDGWQEGVKLGAVRDGERLLVSLVAPAGWKGRLRFDYARHRRELNFARNYVRLNEWPEWFTVDENTLYRLTDDGRKGGDPPGLRAEGRHRGRRLTAAGAGEGPLGHELDAGSQSRSACQASVAGHERRVERFCQRHVHGVVCRHVIRSDETRSSRGSWACRAKSRERKSTRAAAAESA